MSWPKKEGLREILTCASEARLDPTNLTKSLADNEKLYGQAKFDEASKLGFFRTSIKEVELLSEFVKVRTENNYETHGKDITNYKSMKKTFCAPSLSTSGSLTQDVLDQQDETENRVLEHLDGRVKNMEFKIDSLTDQITNLTLMVKKSSLSAGEQKKKWSWKDSDYDIVCSYLSLVILQAVVRITPTKTDAVRIARRKDMFWSIVRLSTTT